MTKRIFQSIFIAVLVVLLICITLIMGVLFQYFQEIQEVQLKSELNLAATAVESQGMDYLKELHVENFRLTWVDDDGSVLFDSKKDIKEMENHSDREEIQEARQTGIGKSERYSITLTEKTVYYAQLLSNGSILRISVAFATIPALLFGMLQPILIVLILSLILSFFLSSQLTKKIIQPINEIDLEHPLENSTYDELSPFLTRIERQHKKILEQKNELLKKKQEFYSIIENMSEGLVLLDSKGIVLSINPAAKNFFHNQNAIGKNIIELDRTSEINKAVQAAQQYKTRSLHLGRNGFEYQINISPIETENNLSGIVILIFDISEKVYAERNRREFTANVSHELKTPLHSIMGSAELLENGLVKQEDVPRFIGHIRTEASRLVSLIEDTIRLSQLDEYIEPEIEPVDLFDLVSEEIQTLLPTAKAKNISITIDGQQIVMMGARQLLHEIIYNLCDNAIKYNVPNGSVKVSIFKTEKDITLTVFDSGIGIPEEHQERIFERFYRVDKSRSKETGGTGLGLSIVKHAVQYMNGTIRLESKLRSGTIITINFPQ